MLIFTLLLLSIALMAALSLATAVVVGTKSARDTNKSVQAFQTADSGVEKILMAIKNNTTDNLSDLGTCSGGNVTGTVRAGDSYAITLYDGEDKEVSCSDTTRKVSEIRKIKSVGKFGGTVRAVETAVASGENITGGCLIKWQGMGQGWIVQSKWGGGCDSKGTHISEAGANMENICENFQVGSAECGILWIQDYANTYSCLCAQ